MNEAITREGSTNPRLRARCREPPVDGGRLVFYPHRCRAATLLDASGGVEVTLQKSLETVAWNGAAADFFAAVDEQGLPSGADLDQLLLSGISNTHVDERYWIAGFLLDRGARPVAVSPAGSGALVLALSRRTHALAQTVRLVERLIDGGADPNQRGERGATPSHYLPNLNMFTDDQLQPLYDLWFTTPGLRFDIPNKAGKNAIELAQRFPDRTDLVARMEKYRDR